MALRVVYCERCIDYLKSCGYKLYTGGYIDPDVAAEDGIKCEFCEDEDAEDLREVMEL